MLAVMIGVGAVATLLFIARSGQFGDYAKSPQTVELAVGSSRLVAGGRAKIWFGEVQMDPMVEISCKDGTRYVEVGKDTPSEECCGIRLRLLELKEERTLRGKFEVTW